MKLKLINSVALCLLTSVSTAYAASLHDNEVLFVAKEALLFNTIKITKFMITSSQPYGTELGVSNFQGLVYYNNGSSAELYNAKIVISAGRKRSKEVVNQLKSDIAANGNTSWSKGNAMFAGMSVDDLPKELNFAMKVNATISFDGGIYQCNDFYIAQGSNGAGINNWWVISNNNLKNQTITCDIGHLSILGRNLDNNKFDIAKSSY